MTKEQKTVIANTLKAKISDFSYYDKKTSENSSQESEPGLFRKYFNQREELKKEINLLLEILIEN